MSMYITNPYQTYQTQGVMTASPIELVIMLYDGCIKKMKIGCIALEEKQIEAANTAFQKAQNIVEELAKSLDMQYDISKDIMKIYEFVLDELIDANINKDTSKIPPLVEIMSDLKDAWQQVAQQNRGKQYAMESE